ncbi:MAG: DUF2953 domain-containing protein [Clostridiales bacterium]|nr:DUF2953 domain-containing protein [Candidatus Equinaster intestinalis]
MTVLKIIGIVLLCILGLIFLLLLCPVRVELRYASGAPFIYKIKLLFITVVNKSAKKKTDEKEKTAEPKKETADKKKKSKKTDIHKILKIILSVLKRMPVLLRNIRVEKLNAECVCAGTDAAETAIKYGALCSVIYPLASLVQEKCMAGRSPKINLSADFESSDTVFDIHLKLGCLLIFAVILVIKVGIDYAKNGGIQNEGKQ